MNHVDRSGITENQMIKIPLSLLALTLTCGAVAAETDGQSTSLVVEGWHHRVWSVYPLEKLKADASPPLTPKSDIVEIRAARGEHEPFILAMVPTIPLREMTLKVEDLHGPNGAIIPASALTSWRVGYVPIDEPSGTRIPQPMPYPTTTGQLPDPLLRDAGSVRPAHCLQFLVDVAVPRDAAPGDYEGTVHLRFRKESWMPATLVPSDDVKLRVHVRPFALPEHSPLLNTSYANLRELPESQRSGAPLAAMQRDFIAHRQTPEPLVPSPVVKVDKGQLTVDSKAWEAAVSTLLDEQHGTHIFVPVWGFYPLPAQAQGLYFLYHYPAVVGQKWLGAPICAEDKTLTPEFKTVFGAYLKHIHGVLKQRGWLDKAFITTMDEPYTYHTGDRAKDIPVNNYEVVRNFVAFVRETAPGLRTFCTADPVEGLVGSIDHWCLRNLDHAEAARERATKHGEIVTFCDNYRTFIDYPAVSARSLGWLAWSIGARGWLTYETLGAYRNAWESTALVYPQMNGATVWGMGQMFYPEPFTGAVLPSLRWELMREGCDDYEYLWLLREALKTKPDAEAQKLLDTAAQQVVAGSGDAEVMAKTATKNANSNRTPHDLRERIADAIERLSR